MNALVESVSSPQTASASVKVEGETFKFSFGLPKGDPGANGKDGKDGKDGTNGTDGKPGPQGTPGADGAMQEYIYKLVENEDAYLEVMKPDSKDEDDYVPDG